MSIVTVLGSYKRPFLGCEAINTAYLTIKNSAGLFCNLLTTKFVEDLISMNRLILELLTINVFDKFLFVNNKWPPSLIGLQNVRSLSRTLAKWLQKKENTMLMPSRLSLQKGREDEEVVNHLYSGLCFP